MSTTREIAKRLDVMSFEIEGANGGTKQQPLCGDRCRFMEPNSCGCSDASHLMRAAAARLDELERENARLKRELVKIAASKTAAELDDDQYDSANFEGGYGILIDIARAALAGSGEK